MRRRQLSLLIGGAVGWPLLARAQKPLPEIGLLGGGRLEVAKLNAKALATGLKTRGYVDGQNVAVIVRGAEFGSGQEIIAEFIHRKVTVIFAAGPKVIQEAHRQTSQVPIVALDLESDPVKSGFVQSLSRPGGNITGLFFDFPEFSGKWLELLGEVVPGLQRIGVLWDPSIGAVQLDSLRAAAAARGQALEVLNIETPASEENAFRLAVEAKVQAVVLLSSPLIYGTANALARIALAHRLPAIMLFREFAEAGGLMSYGPNFLDLYRQGGEIVAKLLAGAKPADLPIERPSRFQLVVNLKTAQALGLIIPALTLGRADQVIE